LPASTARPERLSCRPGPGDKPGIVPYRDLVRGYPLPVGAAPTGSEYARRAPTPSRLPEMPQSFGGGPAIPQRTPSTVARTRGCSDRWGIWVRTLEPGRST
jgi:hypothetical protein